jgi:uncharacterized coiled-coil DUF342 family protein
MSITNITPAEQALELQVAQLKTERDHYRKQSDAYRKECDHARELLDQARNLIREMDQKIMRGKS